MPCLIFFSLKGHRYVTHLIWTLSYLTVVIISECIRILFFTVYQGRASQDMAHVSTLAQLTVQETDWCQFYHGTCGNITSIWHMNFGRSANTDAMSDFVSSIPTPYVIKSNILITSKHEQEAYKHGRTIYPINNLLNHQLLFVENRLQKVQQS